MPELKISLWDDEAKNLSLMYSLMVRSLMCYPLASQAAEREGYLAGLVDKIPGWRKLFNTINITDEKTLGDFHYEAVKNAPRFKDLHRKAHKNFCKALLAGRVLLILWWYQQRAPGLCVGVNVACDDLSQRLGGQTLSKKTIQFYWQKYRIVAPLYAATMFQPGMRSQREPKFNLDFFRSNRLLKFLESAKQLEDFATCHIPKQGRQVPLITKAEVWSIKINSEIPFQLRLKAPPLHSDDKRFVKPIGFRNKL